MLNETLFESKKVLGMYNSGKQLKFTFDTSLLTPFPVLATPVPETPPATSNPIINPANYAMYGNPAFAPVNPIMYQNQSQPMDPQTQMMHNQMMQNQMMFNNQQIYMNPGMYGNQMAPMPGTCSQPPGMYNNQMMYNPAMYPGMVNPAMGAAGVEMTTPVASPVPPIFVPMPAPSAPLVGTDVTGPH